MNTMFLRRTCLLVLLFVFLAQAMTVASRRVPRDPEEPWPRDPDLSAVTDSYLLELWDDTMVAYRRANPAGSPVSAIQHATQYTSMPKSQEAQEHLINALARALDEEPINWDEVRVILLLMYGGMDPDPRIPALVERLLTLPRPMKMSAARNTAYAEATRLLVLQQSDEAASVLYAATHREFWGDDPFLTARRGTGSNTEATIIGYRRGAFSLLLNMPPRIAIPYVEKMLEIYPVSYEPEEIVIGTRYDGSPRVVHDFTHERIQSGLNHLYTRLAREEQNEGSANGAPQ